MAKELDTNWFNLSNYDKFSEFDLSGWYWQLSNRMTIRDLMLENPHTPLIRGKPFTAQNYIEALCLCIKDNPICYCDITKGCKQNFRSSYPFDTDSIQSTPSAYLWCEVNLSDTWDTTDIWDACMLVTVDSATDEEVHISNTPIDLLLKERGVDNKQMSHLTVNLEHSDEQLIKDFRHWLTEYRRFTGYEAPKVNFTDKDFSEWVQWRLLPFIDLTLIAEIEDKAITRKKIGELIFPDEYDVGLADRIKRTIKPKADWLMLRSTINAMGAELKNGGAT